MIFSNRIFGPKLLAIIVGAFLGFLTSLDHLTAKSNIKHHTPKLSKPGFPSKSIVDHHDSNDGIMEEFKHHAQPAPQPAVPTPFRVDTSALGQVVNPHPFTYDIEPKNACKKKDLFMVAYVHTAPDNFDRRMHIRKTWGNTTLYSKDMEVFFMIGKVKTKDTQKAIEEEARHYQDIVQESFVDAYSNLSIKAIGAMRWVSSRCKQVKFILKTDDDVFVNTFSIMKHLHDLDKAKVNSTGLLMCLVWYRMHVLRDGKWNISESVIPDEFYPPYCSGMGYIMSIDVAEAIVTASAYVPFFWVDDVYITGMVPKKMQLQQVTIMKLFMGRKEIEFILGGDDWFKYFFSHLRDIPFNRKMWNILVKRAQAEKIPDMPTVVAGKIAMKYGPKKPPEPDKKKPKKPPPKKKSSQELL